MKRFFTVAVTILVVLFSVFIIQNAQAVPLEFMFWTAMAPLSLLMILCAAVGFTIGIFMFGRSKRHASRKPSQAPTRETSEADQDANKKA